MILKVKFIVTEKMIKRTMCCNSILFTTVHVARLFTWGGGGGGHSLLVIAGILGFKYSFTKHETEIRNLLIISFK